MPPPGIREWQGAPMLFIFSGLGLPFPTDNVLRDVQLGPSCDVRTGEEVALLYPFISVV